MTIYYLFFYLHMLGFLGWAGITTGAYYLMELSGGWTTDLIRAYWKLLYLELGSLALLTLSGAEMWSQLGYPSWVHPALAISPLVALAEYIHLTSVRKMMDRPSALRRRLRYLSWYYTLITLFIIYDMVFKPDWF
jgi:hypothetical protein